MQRKALRRGALRLETGVAAERQIERFVAVARHTPRIPGSNVKDVPAAVDHDRLRIMCLVSHGNANALVWTARARRGGVNDCRLPLPRVQTAASAGDFGDKEVPLLVRCVVDRVASATACGVLT